jgi:poly-gamma-glutamate synthase PgsB/CapB
VSLTFSAAILAALLAFLLWERIARDRALAAIPIRIHVNGTRGKSTVTRLIAGALREAGIRTVAKTTGTEPRVILPDGSERAVRRRAPASIREQLWLLREAHRLHATAVVVECMAVDRDLQDVCEHQMIRSTIGVITNARPDHAEVMGPAVEDVAMALASTVPDSGTLVIGPTDGAGILARAAHSRGTRVVQAETAEEEAHAPGGPSWVADNTAIALAVAGELGIAAEVAWRGIRNACPDPGALRSGTIDLGGRRLEFIDASAANDPQSLGLILGTRTDGALFVFHHRADRPARLVQFGELAPWSLDADTVVVTGDRPDWSTWRRLQRRLPAGRAAFRAPRGLADELRRRLTPASAPALVVFCGNTKGFKVDAVLAGMQQS